MKKILFVVTQSEMGGAQQFLRALVGRLDKTKFEVLVAAGPAESGIRNYELLDQLEKEGTKTVRLKYLQREIRPISDLIALFEFKRVINEFKPDTLFLLSSKAGLIGSLAAKFQVLPIAKQSGILDKVGTSSKFQVIYRIGGWSFNDPWPKWKKWLWIILERFSSRWKDIIIVNNRHDLEQARELKIKPREKVALVYNGLDVYKMEYLSKEEARLKLYEKAVRQAGRVFQGKTIIGTIANFYPTKGLKYLIEAAEHFKNKDHVIFIVIGDVQERKEL